MLYSSSWLPKPQCCNNGSEESETSRSNAEKATFADIGGGVWERDYARP